MDSRYIALNTALEQARTEQDIAKFLKQDLYWLRCLNRYAWNGVICKAELPVGTDFRADYVVLSACSGCWYCVLIEMQSPTDHIFLKNGEAGKGLREAQHQIQEWKAYIRRNETAFREQLSKLAIGKPAYCSNAEVHLTAESEIRDAKTVIQYRYVVLIGRRSFLDQKMNEIRGMSSEYEIVTFDRLLDYAKRMDESNSELGR